MDPKHHAPAPVIADIARFDQRSGSLLERLLFNNRPAILAMCVVATLLLGFAASKVKLVASFDQMIPTHQPFIVNYFDHYADLQGQGNAVQIAVEANEGTIIDAHYLHVLQTLNDAVYLLPGVDRAFMTSLWTPNTRWIAVTPAGLDGGAVITQDYDGSPKQQAIVEQNIQKTGQIGQLVSPDFKSSMIYVPLLRASSDNGQPLDYGELAQQFDALRTQYATQGVTLHITGFAMVVGDLINGIDAILSFFGVAVVVAVLMIYWYTRCSRSTTLVVVSSLIAVIWQLGLVSLLGYSLNPYSVLVPFLIFAIGTSHGAQKMNGVVQDIGRGTHPLVAARYTFRRLFLAGFAALTCDAVSFAVLMTIRIDAIRELALISCIGVGILIFTNLIMLPMLLSYTGVSRTAALRSLRSEMQEDGIRISHPLWNFLDLFTQRRYAAMAIAGALGLGCVGWYVGRDVQVGDLERGAPEFRADSQYNRDKGYIDTHYMIGSDTFVVLGDTPPYGCTAYDTAARLDSLGWKLSQLPEVAFAQSIGSASRVLSTLLNEGSLKWYDVPFNKFALNELWQDIPAHLTNNDCSYAPIYVSLLDHKASTLDAVVTIVNDFVADPANGGVDLKITMAGGGAGIDAATNFVIKQANQQMLYLVYAAVIVFCLITFRSWRAVLCAVLPLVLTSVLAEALMVWLGIGIKVATLPVIALGVGIGVDYALYVLSIMLRFQRAGTTLSIAYHRTLLFTGRVVLLTGFTLAAGVATWVWAPIKFQADMGLLLSFMFLWNMLGALVLLPSLACFLLPTPKALSRTTTPTYDAPTAYPVRPVEHTHSNPGVS